MENLHRLTLRCLLPLIFLLGLPLPAPAEISFSVSPIRVELNGEPGGSHTDVMEVNNEGNEKVRIKISMQDWYLTEEGIPVFQKGGSQPHSCTGWLKINPVDFLLQPGEKKTIRYSVTIPQGTGEGGYWGAFVFETVPQVTPGQKAKAVALKGNIASILYVTAGKPLPAGEIADMAFQQDKEEGKIATRLRNNGTTPFRLKGTVQINDRSGKTLQTLDIPDVPVLVGFTRTITLPFREKLPAGEYTAVATVDTGGKAILVGEIPFTIK